MNLFLYTLVVIIWGTTWIAIVMQQGAIPAPVSVFWRFAIASLIMLLVMGLRRRLRPMTRRDHLFCLLQGACVFCLNFWCFYRASSWISSGLESVIFSMAVLFNAINNVVFWGQRPPARFFTAAAMGLTGIVALFWEDLLSSQMAPALLAGIGLSALGTYGFSLGNMITLRHQKHGLDTLTTNTWAMCYGTGIMGGIVILRGDSFALSLTPHYLGALLYLALFGSVVAFGVYFTLVRRIGAGQAAYSTLLFPLVALTISTVAEGYRWNVPGIAGLALILCGNLVMFAKPGWWRLRRRQIA